MRELPRERDESLMEPSRTNDATQKLVFVCNRIKSDNGNTTEYQRARLLTQNFHTAIIYRWDIPDTIRSRSQETYKIGGGVLSVVRGICLIAYLRIAKGYRVLHTSPEIFSIIWGLLSKYVLGYIWIYDLWDHPSLEFATGRPLVTWVKRFLFHTFLKRSLLYADRWIVAMHEGVLKHLPASYPQRKIIKVTNGVDLGLIDQALNDTAGVSKHRDSGTLDACYAGPVTPVRGIPMLLQCFDSLNKEYRIEANLFGERNEEMVRMIEDHNQRRSHKVHYHGYLSHDRTLARLAESDVCLCILDSQVVSFDYSYPVKLFEYLALGKIVIASRTSAMAEVIEDGYSGFLVSHSVEDLAAVFDQIIDMKNKGNLAEVSQAARKTAERYSWHHINDTILSGLHVMLKARA